MNYLLLCSVLIGVNPGDFMLTRNLREADNQTPGYWNHAAVYVGDGWVVEAQEKPGRVIFTPFTEFCNRYPYILVLRPKGACFNRLNALIFEARNLVGHPYDVHASARWWFFWVGCGENCVSVVRKSYCFAYQFDPGWKVPDDIARDWRLCAVESKGL